MVLVSLDESTINVLPNHFSNSVLDSAAEVLLSAEAFQNELPHYEKTQELIVGDVVL